MTALITVSFTHFQDMANQLDAYPEDLTRVGGTKTTVKYAATREVWEKHFGWMDGVSGISSYDWQPGYGRSAGSAAGRIAKALQRAAGKEAAV